MVGKGPSVVNRALPREMSMSTLGSRAGGGARADSLYMFRLARAGAYKKRRGGPHISGSAGRENNNTEVGRAWRAGGGQGGVSRRIYR